MSDDHTDMIISAVTAPIIVIVYCIICTWCRCPCKGLMEPKKILVVEV
ncbi:MAG: hypothetical protein LBJ93_00870 [Clostridiales bacterium]|nr:hypothetical protein [Clostridiales bacterium]